MILIVDDKSENIFALKSVLEINNFKVDTALSGEEALKKILKTTYSLIILDVQMPVMDGFEVAEAISGFKKAKHTPIIFLSAVNTHKNFITKGYTSGAIDYITKPVDTDVLLLKVKTFHRLFEQTNALNDARNVLQKEVEVRKQTELTLQETIQEYYSILESIPQIAFTAKADGSLEYVNEHWFAYSKNRNEFPETDSSINLADNWKKAIATSVELELEVRIKNLHSLEFRYHLLKAIPVVSDGHIVKWVATFTDINQQKVLNELLEKKVDERTKELLEINKELELSNHDLQQFASVASHDLKEPLRKILVFSNIIKDRHIGNNQDVTKYLDKIILSSGRMNKLINDLLNYSRLSEARLFEVSDVNKIIEEILIDLELLIVEKKAVINVEPIPEMEVIPGLIRQLFQNLISNALKFSKAEVPPVIDIRSKIVSHQEVLGPSTDDKHCCITIRDNGIGFDEKYTTKIFTLFQRLNSREKYEGTGIGLAIAKKIMDKHNGLITATSQENQGATFNLVLPVRQTPVVNKIQTP